MLPPGIYVALTLPSCILLLALCVASYHLARLRAQLQRQHRLSTATFVWVPPKAPVEQDSGRWSSSEQTTPSPGPDAGAGSARLAVTEPSELERESFEVVRASYIHLRRASMETLVLPASPPPAESSSDHSSSTITPWLVPVAEEDGAEDPIPDRPSAPSPAMSSPPASPPTTPPRLGRKPSLNGTPSLNTIYELPPLTSPDPALSLSGSLGSRRSESSPSPPPGTPNSFSSFSDSTTAPPTPPHTPPRATPPPFLFPQPPSPTSTTFSAFNSDSNRNSSHTFGPALSLRPLSGSSPSPLTLPPSVLARAASSPALGLGLEASPTRRPDTRSDPERFYSLPLSHTTPGSSSQGVSNARLAQRRRQARRVGSGVSLADLFKEDDPEAAAQDAVRRE